MAAVLVLPPGHTREDVERHRTPVFGGPESFDGIAWSAPDLADGWIKLEAHPLGFDLLILRFAENEYYRDRSKVLGLVEQFAKIGGPLGALFGYLTRHDYEHLDESWIASEVLTPLLLAEYDEVRNLPFRAVLIEPHAGGADAAGHRERGPT
jgi:hypothetical protein